MATTMIVKPIPSTGELLPVVGIGTYRGFDVSGSVGERQRLSEVVRLLFAAGGSIVDSSPMYGRAEARAGEALAATGGSGRAFIMTKVWTSGRTAGIAQMKDSLRLFGVRRIALMQHAARNAAPLAVRGHCSVCRTDALHGLGLRRARTDPRRRTHRFPANSLFDRRDCRGDATPALCRERKVAVIANVPLGRGALLQLPDWAREIGADSWARFFLKYLLAHPDCT